MHFPTLDKARKWILGDAQKQKPNAGSLLELKARAGSTVFELSPAQINEAINAFKRLGEINMSLTEAVDFAIKHSRPDAGVISVEEAIEKAIETKKFDRVVEAVSASGREGQSRAQFSLAFSSFSEIGRPGMESLAQRLPAPQLRVLPFS